MKESENRDVWFILDEADSLGKVSSLKAGLTKLRKYGGKVVLGLQTISQLRTTYGRDEAQTLLANISTKLVLRAGDGETAEYFSHEFGMQDIEREMVSHTKSGSFWDDNSRESETHSVSYSSQRTVLASEIAGLPDLKGYLKIPGVPIGRVKIDYKKREEVAESFVDIAKKIQEHVK
jgi:type IV secretory pathway TraG/TraD family ATPase VirD4